MSKNTLIDLLVKKCKDKKLLLYDSNLVKQLEALTDDEIIEYILKRKYMFPDDKNIDLY